MIQIARSKVSVPTCGKAEVVVWSHSRSRRLLRVPLSEYLEAVAVAGYSEPRALRTCEESLERVGLQSKGELRDHCWELLGWASPYGIPDDAEENAWDAAALCNLGLFWGVLRLTCIRESPFLERSTHAFMYVNVGINTDADIVIAIATAPATATASVSVSATAIAIDTVMEIDIDVDPGIDVDTDIGIIIVVDF